MGSTKYLVSALATLLLPTFINGQTSFVGLDAAICHSNSPVTTFSACNNLYSSIDYCAGPSVGSGEAIIECYCNQKVFDGYYKNALPLLWYIRRNC